jgi:type II secretion system (T2SS) protein E
VLALQRGDGVAARNLAVPPVPVQARLLRGRTAIQLRGARRRRSETPCFGRGNLTLILEGSDADRDGMWAVSDDENVLTSGVSDPESATVDYDIDERARRPALGRLLIQAGVASEDQIQTAVAEGMRTGLRLGEIVVRHGWATEEQVAQLLAVQWQLRFRKANAIAVEPLAIRRLPAAHARRLRAVPVWFDDDGLVMAIEEPRNDLFVELRELLGNVSYVVVARSALDSLLKSRFLSDETVAEETGPPDEPLTADPTLIGETVTESSLFVDESPFSAAAETEDGEPIAEDVPEAAETAPLEHDEFETYDVDKVEAPAEPATVEVVLSSIEVASAELRTIQQEIESLGESLRLAHEQLAAKDAQLQAVESARLEDGETISGLQSELAQHGNLFDALRMKVDEFKATLDPAE